MADYRLSNEAKIDLIRIHQYGIKQFGVQQADLYFKALFDCFDNISERPYSFESVDYIKSGYRRCVCGSDSIYFKINNERVEIMAVIGKQDLSNIL